MMWIYSAHPPIPNQYIIKHQIVSHLINTLNTYKKFYRSCHSSSLCIELKEEIKLDKFNR